MLRIAIVEDEAGMEDMETKSAAIRDTLIPKMGELREACDRAEAMTAKSFWPYPSYADILFSVH